MLVPQQRPPPRPILKNRSTIGAGSIFSDTSGDAGDDLPPISSIVSTGLGGACETAACLWIARPPRPLEL